MEIGKTGNSGVVEWFSTVHDSFFPVRECLELENLALLASHSAAKLLCSYHSICTMITISCVTNKNTSCYRLTSSSVKESALNNHVVLSIRPKNAIYL